MHTIAGGAPHDPARDTGSHDTGPHDTDTVTVEFALPDLGEGLTDAEIVSWSVRVGDTVALDEVLGEVETAKAVVELPSPHAGTIDALLAEPGETVPVGDPLVRFRIPAPAGGGADTDAGDVNGNGNGNGSTTPPVEPVLVGYGPTPAPPSRRRRPAPEAPAPPTPAASPTTGRRTPAVPAARRRAAALGLDLADVPGTGRDGAVTVPDVERSAGRTGSALCGAAAVLGDGDRREPVRGVRRAAAEAVTRAAHTIPHATVQRTCDASAAVEFVRRLRAAPSVATARPTILTLAVAALAVAARRVPRLTAVWDDGSRPTGTGHEDIRRGDGGHTDATLVVRDRVHVGIATATDAGLVVPVVRDVDPTDLALLAVSIRGAVDAARNGRATPADLTGATVSVTDIGVFGVDAGSAIVPPGQSAVLILGAVAPRPWVVDGSVTVRDVVTLGLSFDHRVLDGAEASLALAAVADVFADPGIALLTARRDAASSAADPRPER